MGSIHYYCCCFVIYTRVNNCENKFAIQSPIFQTDVNLCNRPKVLRKYARNVILPEYIIEGAYNIEIKDLREISERCAKNDKHKIVNLLNFIYE